MTKKQAEILKKMKNAKVLIDYKDYSWLLKNYEALLEDADIINSPELKKAEEDLRRGQIIPWEDAKHALKLCGKDSYR